MLHKITPIFRIFDEQKAREFYVNYLGFKVDWEHRFEQDLPLYMQISLSLVTIHLSEHHGDGTPGSAIRIEIDGLQAFHANLASKGYRFLRPGIEDTPWNTKEMTLTDPFGNRMIFYENDKE